MKKHIILFHVLIFLSLPLISKAETNSSPSAKNRSGLNEKNETITPYSTPEKCGMSSGILSQIDPIVKEAITQKVFPGCQIVVLKDGKMVYNKCFGNFTYDQKEKVKPNTLYDLASLSKTTGTLLAIMKLFDNGKLKLTDKASKYLTFLRGTDKENITINELLFHESGLPGSLNFYNLVLEKKDSPCNSKLSTDPQHQIRLVSTVYRYNPELVSKVKTPEYNIQVEDSFFLNKSVHAAEMKMIAGTKLRSKTYLYSCINFILLKEIAETVSGMPMNEFLTKEFYSPMQLKNISYLPLETHQKETIAPTMKTDFLRGGLIQGYVHDPAAAFSGNVSGNAGLFATATDVATVYQMLLNNGELAGKRFLSEETCKLFTTETSASGRRGLGFDKPTPSSPRYNPCCLSAPKTVYGHTGYTGTCCWVDPANKLVYVFLSNRTFPDDGINKLARLSIRPKIQEIIYQSIK